MPARWPRRRGRGDAATSPHLPREGTAWGSRSRDFSAWGSTRRPTPCPVYFCFVLGGIAGERRAARWGGRHREAVVGARPPLSPLSPPAACWWLCSPWEAPQGRWLVKYFLQRWGKRLVGSELNPRGCVRSGGCCTAAQRGLRSPFGERGPWGRAEPGGLAWVKNLQEEKVSGAGRTWKNRFGEYKWNFLSPQLSDSLSPVAFAAVVETSSRAGCRSGCSGAEGWYGQKLGL